MHLPFQVSGKGILNFANTKREMERSICDNKIQKRNVESASNGPGLTSDLKNILKSFRLWSEISLIVLIVLHYCAHVTTGERLLLPLQLG